MANNIINNNPTIVKNHTTTISKTFNSQPRRNLGRGALSGVDTANNWFGGIVDTLTGFGVFKFFFLAFLILTFLRMLFNASGVTQDMDFFELLTLLNSVEVIDYSWIDKFSEIMTSYTLPQLVVGKIGVLLDIAHQIAMVLWYPVKAILYLFTAIMRFSNWLGIIFNWFAMGGINAY